MARQSARVTSPGRSTIVAHWPLQTRGMQRIEPHAVDQLGRPLDVPDGEVAALAGFQRADVVEPAERARRLARHAGKDLVDGQPEQRRGHVHRQQQRGERRGAGIAVGGDGDRHAVLAEQVDRRLLRLAEEVEGAGQQHGDRAGLGHRGRARLVGVFEVVGRQRAVARRQRRAAEVGELVGVQLDRQARRLAASNTRAVCAPVKAMPSQKASTASARPSAATAGSIWAQSRAM